MTFIILDRSERPQPMMTKMATPAAGIHDARHAEA
jgi:hypothetical protein